MSSLGVNGVGNGGQTYQNTQIDDKEWQVIQKLIGAHIISSVQEFMSLTEDQKADKVKEYNRTHPNDPIEDKNQRDNAVLPPEAQTTQGIEYPPNSDVAKFLEDMKKYGIHL